jgi:hypothetical protein
MAGYQPLKITGMTTGLVQEREQFILPNDAYPVLQNAFVWRERIKRKQGYELLGRLRRVLTSESIGNYTTTIGTNTLNIFTGLGVAASQPDAEIEVGSISNITITFAAPIGQSLTDTTGTGTLTVVGAGPITSATINYSTGVISITGSAVIGPAAATFTGAYYPKLPVMGLRSRELNNINSEMLIAFDQIYAYRFVTGWQEFIPGTTWTGNDSDFFWSTNYWVNAANNKLFWVTNFSGTGGDPIRYTDGTTWTNFAPTINAAGDVLAQCLCILPFRGRLVTFNTLEGANLAASVSYPQRIRWSAIGDPLAVDAWKDDIRGKGGFLDVPTSESITSVGFVRDNLVVYCERSTWQLRYTGRSISPFQIEKVNSELGSESTFSAVQFDTSLVGIGDKGIVECDSFKSDRIDIKIPDLVFQFDNDTNGTKRVHGIRDFQQRLAYWTYPYKPSEFPGDVFPNRRLVYNYENDSWAIFTDSLTCLGTFQPVTSRRWVDSRFSWQSANFTWINRPSLFPAIVGGNQQGFVEYLDSKVTNDPSLSIKNITGNTTTATVITSPNHNLETGQVIKITDIPLGSPFASSLNNQKFGVVRVNSSSFKLYKYSTTTGQFSDPQLDPSGTYIGAGKISVRDNFNVVSKKFNFLDEGQNIQIGYIDVLMDNTDEGAITLNMYMDYNDNEPVNTLPQNIVAPSLLPDTFFNSVVPTTAPVNRGSSKNWQRVFCPTRASFLTIEWTLSNAQLVGNEQESDVQIDAQVIWMRKAGTQLPIGV